MNGCETMTRPFYPLSSSSSTSLHLPACLACLPSLLSPSTNTILSLMPFLPSVTPVVVVIGVVASFPPSSSSSFFSKTAPREGTLHPQSPPPSCPIVVVAAASAAGQLWASLASGGEGE